MGLDETLKKVLGDDIYKEKGKELKQELAKEVIPKTEFNDKLESIKALESEKKLLLEEKLQLEKEQKQIEDSKLSDIEKLQKNIELLAKKVEDEQKARTESEDKLKDVELTNSIKSKLSEAKLKPKFLDFAIPKFKGIEDEKFSDKLKEFAENYKEMFGEDRLEGKKPEGSLEGKPPAEKMPSSFSEWKKLNQN